MTRSYILSEENLPQLPEGHEEPSRFKRVLRRAQRALTGRGPILIEDHNRHLYESVALLIAYDKNMVACLTGTAFLYKPNIVITAAHCLSHEQHFNYVADRKAHLVKLYFGIFGTSSGETKIVGQRESNKLFYHHNYNVEFEHGLDIGFMVLDDPIELPPLDILTDTSDVEERALQIIGYPGRGNAGFNGYEIAASSASGGYSYEGRFGYQTQTLKGMSGGPVQATDSLPHPAYAVHANQKDIWKGPRPKRSSGFMLDSDILDWIDSTVLNLRSTETHNDANV